MGSITAKQKLHEEAAIFNNMTEKKIKNCLNSATVIQ